MYLAVVWFNAVSLVIGAQVNTEQRLIETLLQNYNKQSRPVLDSTKPSNVTFGLEVIQLIKVDDRAQSIITKAWVRQRWINELLKWNVSQWGDIKFVQLDANFAWTPDIVLYNNADESFSGGTEKYKTRLSLYSDGLQSWLSPATFFSTCKIDITYFPFDKQECIFKFGSWTYDQSGIDMLLDDLPITTTLYKESAEWELAETSKVRNSVKYACCPSPYVDITYKIVIKRKPLYYLFNVISPCFLLIATVLFGFFLPPESGERISLTITILLAVAVFLQLVSDNLPRNSDSVPLLGIFYMAIMSESALSLIITCVVLIAHHKGQDKQSYRMPRWVRRYFVEIIGHFLGIRGRSPWTGDTKLKQAKSAIHPISKDEKVSEFEVTANGNLVDSDTDPVSVIPFKNDEGKNHRNANIMTRVSSSGNTKVEQTLDSILYEVKFLSKNIKNIQIYERNQEEWRTLAAVLDRMFFWIFLITSIISCVSILVPVYYKNN